MMKKKKTKTYSKLDTELRIAGRANEVLGCAEAHIKRGRTLGNLVLLRALKKLKIQPEDFYNAVYQSFTEIIG